MVKDSKMPTASKSDSRADEPAPNEVPVKFHYANFMREMCAIVGREPSHSVCLGCSGFYHFRYHPLGQLDAAHLQRAADELRQALSRYAVFWPHSRCSFGKPEVMLSENELALEVVIYTDSASASASA
jgi:hypothetical protein